MYMVKVKTGQQILFGTIGITECRRFHFYRTDASVCNMAEIIG